MLDSSLSSSGSPGMVSLASPLTRSSALGIRYITGLGSWIALSIRPYASRGVEGITIFQPGSRVAVASNECEWYRLPRMPAPTGVISTIGTFQSPALDQQVLPAVCGWWVVCSGYSPTWIWAPGFWPAGAGPKAARRDPVLRLRVQHDR